MKTWIAAMAMGLALVASSAYAGDGAVSQDTLASFGLGGMQKMSDTQGKAVRGKFVVAYGSSYASVFGSSNLAGYEASANFLPAATGNSASQVTLNGSLTIPGLGTGVLFIQATATGTSSARVGF